MAERASEQRQDNPHLLVLVSGLDPAALDEEPVLRTLAGPHRAALVPPPADAVAELGSTLPAATLRAMGVAVERRAVCLQPLWRGDEQAVAALGRRPFGPAALTTLLLRGPLLAAVTHGCGSQGQRRSHATLAADLQRALATLQQRGQAHLWLAALGAPVPVAHTLDVTAIARRLVGWPLSHHLSVRGGSAIATVRSASYRALELLAARLEDSALAGAVAVRTLHGLELHAPPSTAFGSRPMFARAAHGQEARAAVAMPQPLRTATSLDLRGLVARVVMAVAANADAAPYLRTPRPVPAEPAPALLPIAAAERGRAPLGAADDDPDPRRDDVSDARSR